MEKGDCADGIERIHRGGAGLKEDWSEGEDPRGFRIFEACRLRRGRAGYTKVCECKCMCMCSLLWTDNEDSVVNQVLNDIPKSVAIIRRVPRGSMLIAVLAHIVPSRKRVW